MTRYYQPAATLWWLVALGWAVLAIVGPDAEFTLRIGIATVCVGVSTILYRTQTILARIDETAAEARR
jgi:hypothetical protein